MTNIQPPNLYDQPRPSFLTPLAQLRETHGGDKGLAQAITSAYRKNMVDPATYQKRDVVDRRKLSKLLQSHRKVVLSMVEIEALHSFLDAHGEGLTAHPFFERTSAVEELSGGESIEILLGSGMSLEGPDLSHWDVMSAIQIQRTFASSRMNFDQFYVPRADGRASQQEPEWMKVLARKGPAKHNVILIGSERSNPATRYMLRRMLGLGGDEKVHWDSLPFYFALYPSTAAPHKLSLSRPVDEVIKIFPKLGNAIERGKGWGLVVDGKFLLSEAATRTTGKGKSRILVDRAKSYALVAAQRQPDHRIFVLVAGLTGPGTLEAATRLISMPGVLPRAEGEYRNAVLWAVLETHADLSGLRQAESLPKFTRSKFIIDSRRWDPVRRREIT